MSTEQEIVLQKKIYIIFSMVILAVTMGVLNIQKTKVEILSNEEENIVKVYTEYAANEEFFKIEVSGEISGELLAKKPSEESKNKTETTNTLTSSEQKISKEESKKSEQEVKETKVVASRGSYVRDTSPVPTEYEKVIQVKATAYCLCQKCCGKTPDSPGYGRTASGLKIVPGTGMKVIAVDTSVVPLGTKVFVEGLNGAGNYGYAVAADTGSAIKNNKIDLYMDTHEQALSWGVKYVNLYILSE